MSISIPENRMLITDFSFEEVARQTESSVKLARVVNDEMDLPYPILVTLNLEKIDILSWLESINRTPKVYWCSRDGQVEIGGVGASMTVTEKDPGLLAQKFGLIERILDFGPTNINLCFLGGANFDLEESRRTEWTSFQTMWYVLPEFYVHRYRDDFYLTISSLFANGISSESIAKSFLTKIEKIGFDGFARENTTLPGIQSRRDIPSYHQWENNVTESLDRIQRGELEKVVLSRRSDLIFPEKINWINVARRLKDCNENCFFYCFQPADDVAFLGASPERLFKIKDRTLISEAVSGTISRFGSLEEDLESGINLLHSEKNLREHQFVVDALKKIKGRFCDNIETHDKPSLLELSNVQHLYTRITGELKGGISIYDLLSTLHPTPAVGGTPREKALQLIRELETFDRGWYAGPVGMLSRETSEIVVALRSLLIMGNEARVYAGAGIVHGSEPESEWEELESKISIALQVFDGK